ncbi:MAG: hypothetical protein LC731_05055, partial [Acidobacteria bacterium]|nr:hypothetical protein [Acidobacteriota bacterium]
MPQVNRSPLLRYGVAILLVTVATINVLDALIALLSSSQNDADNAQSTASISINGKPAGMIQL